MDEYDKFPNEFDFTNPAPRFVNLPELAEKAVDADTSVSLMLNLTIPLDGLKITDPLFPSTDALV